MHVLELCDGARYYSSKVFVFVLSTAVHPPRDTT